MDLEKLCDDVCHLSVKTAAWIKEQINKLKEEDIEEKFLHNYVSYVDKDSEKMLVKELNVLLPEAGILAEESSEIEKSSPYKWIIDPLDGTTNFIHYLPMYCISIGLMKGQEIILGVVYEMVHDECFYATKGGGAFLNKRKIHVSETHDLKKALIATGFPTSGFEGLSKYMSSLEYFIRNSSGVRRYGSAAADLAYVACGRYDAFYEIGLSPWDVAAGSIILEEAGGICSDFKGEKQHIFGYNIMACNRNIYNIFASQIKKNFL